VPLESDHRNINGANGFDLQAVNPTCLQPAGLSATLLAGPNAAVYNAFTAPVVSATDNVAGGRTALSAAALEQRFAPQRLHEYVPWLLRNNVNDSGTLAGRAYPLPTPILTTPLAMSSPSGNVARERVSAMSLRSGWKSQLGYRAPISACIEPMDAVFTWVNGSDPTVAAARVAALEELARQTNSDAAAAAAEAALARDGEAQERADAAYTATANG